MNPVVETILLEIKESFFMALAALRTNKLRSLLTLLGIAVGVFSIIGVMTAMGVVVSSIENGMSFLGAHTFQVQKFPNFRSGNPKEWAKMRNRKDITYTQALAVKERTTLAKAVGMFTGDGGKVVISPRGEKTNPNIFLSGRDIEGFEANNWTITDGRLFTQEELSAGKFVTIVGTDVTKKLFPYLDPIGETIRVDGRDYKIIGVVQTQGNVLGGGGDNIVTMPITTYFNVYGKEQEVNLKVVALNAEVYDDCLEQVRGILRTVRHVPPDEDDDFAMTSNDSVVTQFNELTKYIRLGILLISAIALVAAGVGIMNIMLVSVTERTREIGIRKAIGARKSNILTQFVLEAVVLSELGGFVGILMGILGGNLTAMALDVNPVIPYDWVAIGFISCSIIGIVFGVYPAWKAANLDPIDSLRYE